MNKKVLFLCLLSLSLFSVNNLYAQKADYNVIGFELGTSFAYNFGAEAMGNGYSTAIVLPLTNSFSANFTFLNGSGGLASSSMLGFNYALRNKLGVSLGVGRSGANSLVNLGMYLNILERKVQEGLSTILKLRVNYEAVPVNGLENGTLVMGLALGFGI